MTTVAFEAKVRDSQSGTVVAMFADREMQKYKPLDFKAFTWYGNAKNKTSEGNTNQKILMEN